MRSWVVVLAGGLALAVAAWAGDPWKEKTYKEWTEQETTKILIDSPWARPITVVASWRKGDKALPDAAGQRTGDAASARERSGGISTDVTNTVENEVGGVRPGETEEARFILRWSSSRTVREALVRMAILKGTPEAEAEKRLSAPEPEHHMVLYGGDMTPFANNDEMTLMQSTALKLKKSKNKLTPTRVEITRSSDGKRVVALGFYFATKTESGQPTISADEKAVDFELRNGIVTLRQTFDLQKMVGKAGPDLP